MKISRVEGELWWGGEGGLLRTVAYSRYPNYEVHPPTNSLLVEVQS